MEGLTRTQKSEFITSFLSMFGKTLSSDQLATYLAPRFCTKTLRIIATKETSLPLFLRALLEELRVFGAFVCYAYLKRL